VWYTPTAAGTVFTGGATTFLTGELITYTGTLDSIGSCHATSMTVKPKVTYSIKDNGQGKITGFGDHFVEVLGKRIIWDANTSYTLKIPAIKIGRTAVWQGKRDAATGIVLASKLTIK
jgi:hypothetical protein